MDFTPELSAFQGVIISADNVHQLSRLRSKGGNEEKIKYVLNCVLKFLKEENFIKGAQITNASTVRKFALYIVLNADLPILEQMVELENLVLNAFTTIPKHLMCEMLWNLHMEQFIYEIITYSYPLLALEVVGAFIDHFKYFNPTDCLEKLYKLCAACYSLICRFNCFKFENEVLSMKLLIAYEHFQTLLKYFTAPPNDYKLNALSKDDLYKYKGKCLHMALLLICECFNQFTSKIDMNYPDLYKLTYKEGCFNMDTIHNICDITNSSLLEYLHNANMAVLDMCKELVMDVSVDVFCAWSEFEENGVSMQQSIGELCYSIRTKLLDVESVCEHPVVSMIQQIARKPAEINDMINILDSKLIIDNINKNDNERSSWVRALLSKDMLCEDHNLLQVIDANVKVFNEEECYKLFNMFKTYLNNKPENSSFIKSLSLKVFQCCNISDKHKILILNFNNNCFTDLRDDQELLDMITETFNKFISSPDADLTEVLTLFLQNPRQVYTKLFSTASENIEQTQIMLEIMKLLQNYSNYYYSTETEPCIISVTKIVFDKIKGQESKEHNFIKFISGLKTLNIIPEAKLLLLIIMPNMHKALLNKDINFINVQIRLLLEAFTVEELLDCRAPMLAMLAQVMDVVRWHNITNFVSTAPGTLQLTIELQTSLIQTYNDVVPEKESKWLKSKLRKMQPLNMYYYRILWNPPGRNFFEVISRTDVTSEMNSNELASLLSQVICSSTQQEWCELWDSLSVIDNARLLKIFHLALTMTTITEAAHRIDATRACLMYCYRNLVYIIRYKFLKEPLTDSAVLNTVCNISSLLKHVPATDVEEIGTLLMPLFAYFVEKKTTLNIDLSKYLNDQFKHSHFANIVGKVFAI